MDVTELIRRGYAALGLGVHPDVLAMFDQLGRRPAEWTVQYWSGGPWRRPSQDVAALDLFPGLPPQYEIIGVDAESWRLDRRRDVLTVSGHYRTRPRGTWEVFRLPFVHVWSIGGGKVQRVLSALDGVELRRQPAAA